jgi:hypothetical protein
MHTYVCEEVTSATKCDSVRTRYDVFVSLHQLSPFSMGQMALIVCCDISLKEVGETDFPILTPYSFRFPMWWPWGMLFLWFGLLRKEYMSRNVHYIPSICNPHTLNYLNTSVYFTSSTYIIGLIKLLTCQLHITLVRWGTMLQAGKSRVRFPMRSLDFLIDLIIPVAIWPGVDSTSNRNEYQESSWG